MKINVKNTLIEKYLSQKELNILVANIYNSYLEECPYEVNKETIKEFNTSSNPVYFAFLKALDIDYEDYEFSRLSKVYHIDEFKELDLNEYQSNAYYKNIKIKEHKYKKWTLGYSSYHPYECFLYDELDIHQKDYYKEISKFGYFKEEFKYIEVKEGDITWMSITPHEINTMKDDISLVKGDILVLGLGLGYFPYMAHLKNDVNNITIIEKDENIIDLFKEAILPNFNEEKITIIKDDAINYLSKLDKHFDYIYCDLYHNANDALPIYLKVNRFEKTLPTTTFLYWIEESILALLRRYVLTIFEENLNGYTYKDYQSSKSFDDELLNRLFKYMQNKSFNSREELEEFLSSKNLKNLAKAI